MQRPALINRIDFKHLKQQMTMTTTMMFHWTLIAIALLQQMETTDAAKFKGDTCVTKNKPGVCKEWGECPIIKTLIDNGEYTSREVVSCGFGIREELICCPAKQRPDPAIETTTLENKIGSPEPTIAPGSVRDFWLDLLENITTSTTPAPDFWLDLLSSTAPAMTTTTTTTIKPLIVGGQRLNESSEFFDFNALLGGNQSGGSKQERQTNSKDTKSNTTPSNQGFITANNNGRGHLNTGPVNINQWSFEQSGNDGPAGSTSSNNGRGHNGHSGFRGNGNGKGNGNFGWGQLNNGNRGHNMGRGGLNSNNGRGGAHNNGRFRNNFGTENQNHGFVFPNSNNNFVEGNPRPGRPVNNMQEQNPNTHFGGNTKNNNNNNNNNNKEHLNNNSEGKIIEDLIKNVFDTSGTTANKDTEPSAATSQVQPNAVAVDDAIANIFNINKPQNPSLTPVNPPVSQINNPQATLWPTLQENYNNHEVVPGNLQMPHHQMEFSNPQASGQFQIIPVVEHQVTVNDLDTAPSTSFIQQPVVVETWSGAPEITPIQITYDNLVNSGGVESQVANVFDQQQQQQGLPGQIFVVQPQQQALHFIQQQPQFIQQQPVAPQNFVQFSQEMVQEPLQMESSGKETRSTSPLQQFVQQTNSGSLPNIQSPPTQILDPFKPFEFRPPPEDENTFSEGNNFLSINTGSEKPDPKTKTERPAVRACRRIEKGLHASLSPHILGGTPAELGEFPHMAAIGYSRIGGDDRPPYDIRCGGTLIDKRYVLTAAHCVTERENVPTIVRLGVVNFTDASQMSAAVEIRIKETYIHDDYLTRLTYNDIAILELEREVEYSEYVYPVCLYMDETDPNTKIKLWVTGWGTVNTTTRSFSDILLKAPLHTSPLKNCNQSFTDYGLNRKIPEGIIRTQFCAEDRDQIKDACQGDSGGPLNMIIDESYKNYRLVGVVSSGFGCASSTPGLYTRVAAFLDFIEKIVWPNGGD